MKKIVLIPDSFKGTMSSIEICKIMEMRIQKLCPHVQVLSIPVADGGEGSVDCFLSALGGQKASIPAHGPLMEEIESAYGLVDAGKTAVIEMAACGGLPLIENRKDPLAASTYGVGEQILHAARSGAEAIIVGLGGSATNDGGCGAACAAGAAFYDKDANAFVPTGGTLERIARIDLSGMDKSLAGVRFTAMCDIDNPLYGPNGAAYIFAPQKGADARAVRQLDRGLAHLAAVMQRDLGLHLGQVPGAGAAGGMGAGMVAFFGAELKMGIEAVLDTVGFDDLVRGADLVVTGEGKIDAQSLRGKVVIGVARRAKAAGVPVAAVVGDIGDDIEQAYALGVSGVFSINRVAVDFQIARGRARRDLELTVDNLLRFCLAMEARRE